MTEWLILGIIYFGFNLFFLVQILVEMIIRKRRGEPVFKSIKEPSDLQQLSNYTIFLPSTLILNLVTYTVFRKDWKEEKAKYEEVERRVKNHGKR